MSGAEPYEARTRCWRCADAVLRASGVPPKWQYTDEDRAMLRAAAQAVPLATRLYTPSCKCGGGCGDEYLCAPCASTVNRPEFVEELGDDHP